MITNKKTAETNTHQSFCHLLSVTTAVGDQHRMVRKIEVNAIRYTFVWGKAAVKHKTNAKYKEAKQQLAV